MIVIHEGKADVHIGRKSPALDTSGFADVLKLAVLLVVQQKHTVFQADGEIDTSVVVIIPGSAADRMQGGVEARFARDIFKLFLSEVMVECHSASGS